MPPEIIKLKKGDRFTVRLKGLSTAGYEWLYESDDDKKVTVQKEASLNELPTVKRIGGATTEVYTLTALQPGETTIHFRLQRKWETDKPPQEEKIVKLIIE